MEIWRDIPGYEGLYQVSSWGNVKSLWYGRKKILKLRNNKNGYLYVSLYKEGKEKHFQVSRLVAQAFIPNPNNLPWVKHKDKDILNNHVNNLEWHNRTPSEETRKKMSKKIKGRTLTEEHKKKIRESMKKYKKYNPFDNIDTNKTWNNCPFVIKVCKKCNKIKVAYSGNFHKSGKNGLRGECKECVNKKKKYNFIIKHEGGYMLCPFAIKVCKKCGKILVANKDNFYEDKHYKNGLTSYCKKCLSEKSIKHHKDNPHIELNSRNRRRSNKPSNITLEQYNELMNYFNVCAYCGKEFNNIHNHIDNKTVEHFISLSTNGTNDIWNLICSCMLCNSDKQEQNPIEWYYKQDFFSMERLLYIYAWIKYAHEKWGNSDINK